MLYKNPVILCDYSDPDVIRVGDVYYMVASSFNFMLGLPILTSTNLVDWKLVNYACERIPFPWYDEPQNAKGIWAPSIRFHGGKFYIFVGMPDEGIFFTEADDPLGKWSELSCVWSGRGFEDPCPIWDTDESGSERLYLVHGYVKSRIGFNSKLGLLELDLESKKALGEDRIIFDGTKTQPTIEGPKFYKRNGFYYIFAPAGGVTEGWQTVLRSRSIYGPYERKIVLEKGSTDINGPHQGALVDTPDGQWWFFHFQSTTPNGRVLHLQPARWKDDWPLIGVDIDGNGIGEPVRVWTKPYPDTQPSLPATSDDFDTPQLGLQWQWCHNPVDTHWSLTEKKGFLTLHTLPADSLKMCRSMLTQKVMGYESQATLLLHATANDGMRGGLAFTGKQFRAIGLSAEGIYTEVNGQVTIVKPCKAKKVWLRVNIDNSRNEHRFSYRLDGRHYFDAGAAFDMREGFWKGIRVGLYAYHTKGDSQTLHFDNFVYDILR